MDVSKIIRKLAKSNKYQTLFSIAKEGTISIFRNTSDYTDNQITFLNFLNFYHNLYTDIALDYVDEIVLENDIYEDAYSYYKMKNRGMIHNKDKDSPKIPQKQTGNTTTTGKKSTWVFKNKKRRQ